MTMPYGNPALDQIVNLFGNSFKWVRGYSESHKGIDLSAPAGTPVYAMAGGRVKSSSFQTKGGNTVSIDIGENLTAYYGHLATMTVKPGQVIAQGQQIGTVGSTGTSTGPHLHYGLWDTGIGGFINPLPNLAEQPGNIDFDPGQFVEDIGFNIEGAVIFIGIILVGIVFVVTAGLINLKGKKE